MQSIPAPKAGFNSAISVGPRRKDFSSLSFKPHAVDCNRVDAYISIDTVGAIKQVIHKFDPNLPPRHRIVSFEGESLKITSIGAAAKVRVGSNSITVDDKLNFLLPCRASGKDLNRRQHLALFQDLSG